MRKDKENIFQEFERLEKIEKKFAEQLEKIKIKKSEILELLLRGLNELGE